MFCKRLSFFERPFEKMEAIFIFCKVRFLKKSSKQKCKRFSYFAELGFFERTLKKT
jgi:hypothetical protein